MDEPTLNWLLEHHRESYRYQLEQRQTVYDRASFLSSPLTLLGGGIIYLFAHYPGDSNRWYALWFYSSIGIATLLFLVSLALILFPVIWGFRYFSILSPSKLQDYANRLTEHAAKAGSVNVLAKIKEHLADRYSDAATRNWQVNYRRSNFVLRGMKICAFAFGFFLIALFPFFWSTSQQPEHPTNVIISNPVRITK